MQQHLHIPRFPLPLIFFYRYNVYQIPTSLMLADNIGV